jgi:hypothetical protein
MGDRVTAREGRWFLRQANDDDYAVVLVSERAPAGTNSRDLKPGYVEVVCDHEDGLQLDAAQLAAFVSWPPEGAGR